MNSFLKQSTAAQSRSTPPFLDDTDFKTAETGLTIANSDVKLLKNGGASADKNSGGGTHRANGCYGLTFDATDSDTVGELLVSIKVAGALPVFMKFWVLEEAIYDALFAGSAAAFDANQRVDLGEWLGSAPNALQSGRVDSYLGAAADAVLTAAKFAAGALDAVWSTAARALTDKAGFSLSAAGIQAIWDAATAALTTAGSIGKLIVDKITGLTFTVANRVDSHVLSTGVGAIDAASTAADYVTEIAAAVWDKARSSHTTAGSFGESFNGVVSFTVAAGSTTTVIETGLTEATNDHYNGGTVVFITGALSGQRATIDDYNGGTKQITVPALTEAPANGDRAVIV